MRANASGLSITKEKARKPRRPYSSARKGKMLSGLFDWLTGSLLGYRFYCSISFSRSARRIKSTERWIPSLLINRAL